jgi:phospholipid/cholesterol/gamma-HCH transport system substrate-binding protein
VGSVLGAVWKASKRKLQGLTFLVVVAGLIALSIAIYDKDFVASVPVTLQTPRIGHQLVVPGYVTLRGVVVGEVRSVSTRGSYADMSLAIKPGDVNDIPANVSAVILPETLFGEKYVQLVVPSHPSSRHIYANETIGYSHTRVSIETSKVFDDVLPLLDALHPVQLSETLSAFADALQGRGNALGQNFTLVDKYLRGFNPHLPTFEYDLRELATVSADYTNAAPYLLALLRNFSVTSRTFTVKQDIYAQFLRGTQGFANTMTNVLTRNEHNLISLANVSRPDLATLAYYSPEFTCLLQGLTDIHPLIAHTFVPAKGSGGMPSSAPELHIVLQLIKPTQSYTYPKDRPRNTLNPGPNCDGLPSAPSAPGFTPPPASSSALGSPASYSTSAGTSTEISAVDALTAPLLRVAGSRVPSYADLLLGPMVRGEVVGFS